jgi:SAM-dependent methyltransferase
VSLGRSSGLDLRQGWIEDISERGFDLIMLSHVVEHFPDPVGTVKGLIPLLAPGGSFFIEVPNADHFILNSLQTAHTYYFSPRTLRRYMGEAGLATDRIAEFASHMAGMFRPVATKPNIDLTNEYSRMQALLLSYQRRERIKAILDGVGLLPAARRLWRALRGNHTASRETIWSAE